MKKITFIFSFCLLFGAAAFAQQVAPAPAATATPVRMARVILKVENFEALEQYDAMKSVLDGLQGVTFSNHQINQKQVVASYRMNDISAAQIKQALVEKGWRAEIVMTSERGSKGSLLKN